MDKGWMATHLIGSIIGAKSATLGPSFPSTFFSHPTALGREPISVVASPIFKIPNRDFHDWKEAGASASRQQRTLMVDVVDAWRARR